MSHEICAQVSKCFNVADIACITWYYRCDCPQWNDDGRKRRERAEEGVRKRHHCLQQRSRYLPRCKPIPTEHITFGCMHLARIGNEKWRNCHS